MPRDLTGWLWLLKLGALFNLFLLARTLGFATPDPHVVFPAWILLAVSAFRCLFPNRYVHNVVFHDTPWSSIFGTRVLATFSEVAYIYQFSTVLRTLNVESVPGIDALAWGMVAAVTISQGFVWGAILTHRLRLYFFEELGWFVLFLANTAASVWLLATADAGDARLLLWLNVGFGAGYLPWQLAHLRSLRGEADAGGAARIGCREGLHRALHERQPRTDADAWGGAIGLTWMVAYWATLIPAWVYLVARVLSER